MIFKDIKSLLSQMQKLIDLVGETSRQVDQLNARIETLANDLASLKLSTNGMIEIQKQIQDYNEKAVSHSMKIRDDFMAGVNSVMGQ